MSQQPTDQLFAHPLGIVPDFTFDAAVAAVFPNMIQRSVPGYSTVIAITGLLARQFSQPGSKLYDLGCSLGASSFAMATNAADGCQLIAVDTSAQMLDGLRQALQQHPPKIPFELRCEDIADIAIENASLVALNYTLQFVPPERRDALMAKIYAGMLPGAALVLSEKVRFEPGEVDALFVDLHHQFKQANGYSELEISQKREALERVLLPESIERHRQRLVDAGFRRVESWFQCFNFVSFIAVK
ncbi:MAG: carboxy-S-adenosyl-L-methionine synthase CmoA [Gammaproteobacteria bacterium]|nr:carboxy-S-adenosyl-L-methionine synthase CmoA [Gammaproteobacteria bacterium]